MTLAMTIKISINQLESSSEHLIFLQSTRIYLRPIQTYTQHGARSTDEKLNV